MCTDLVWVDIVCAFFLTKMPRTENRCNIKHVKKLIFNHLSGSLQNATKSNFLRNPVDRKKKIPCCHQCNSYFEFWWFPAIRFLITPYRKRPNQGKFLMNISPIIKFGLSR